MRCFIITLFSLISFSAFSQVKKDSVNASVLIIPYRPGMHMSDADQDIAEESQMDLGEVRSTIRTGLVKALNQRFNEVHDTKVIQTNFVNDDNNDLDRLYHALVFSQDSTFPAKEPKKYAVKDSALTYGTVFKNAKQPKQYMSAYIRDEKILPELSEKYGTDYFLILNEIDIKTHFEDCINLALKIYRREFTIHFQILDRKGNLLYGDAVTINYPSNNNNVKDIVYYNFPKVADYVLGAFERVVKN